ncbi:CAP domain-containing protein [Massilia sp. S19_KUP03_FR1]|uniref:CAP domain-containing protein n=1 Tax=Massilia sp. S19_KUP03_FR1 TaxID=3025503 RepID=UPI002FCDA75C
MNKLLRLRPWAAGCAVALMLVACGGGGSGNTATQTVSTTDTGNAGGSAGTTVPVEPGAPALSGDIATDGVNWFNFRRSQIGVAQLARNSLIDQAGLNHSNYQRLNNQVTHDEVAGKSGFTGAELSARLAHAGYTFPSNASRAYGEVISATSSKSGAFMAEELITAIYHRFVVFEPMFKEFGGGAATTSAGYTYFTTDFGARNGFGSGITGLVTWPYNGQTSVAPNFFSDYEEPDPVAGINEVGYPVSVHANINANVTVQSFTIQQRGGSNLSVKLLSASADPKYTSESVAAIVPLAPLKAATVYDVSFVGALDGTAITKTWSFTTK